VQRRALGVLFGCLALALVAIAVGAALGAGGDTARWLVAGASLALGAWLGSLSLGALRRSRPRRES
jgi:hypothetical protein